MAHDRVLDYKQPQQAATAAGVIVIGTCQRLDLEPCIIQILLELRHGA